MKKKLREFCFSHWYFLVTAALVLIQAVFSLRFMGRQYFSLDEVSQIGFIAKRNSWSDIINYYLTSEVTNLPLWPLLAAVWYRIVPYGEGWMRLLTVILTSLAMIVLIKAAETFRDRMTGILMALLLCISSALMHLCSLTFRVHAFWMLFTALVLLFYFRRLRSMGKETIRETVILGFMMAGLAYSHYFGCLMIVYLFLIDTVLFFMKKIKGIFIISYLIGGGILFPWFILMMVRHTMVLNEFWPKTPTFASIPKALSYVVSHDEVIFVLLILAMIVSLLSFTEGILSGAGDNEWRFIRLSFAFMPIIFITADYIYSAHINVSGGIFVYRYFLSVMPAALLSVAILIKELTDAVSGKFSISAFLSYGTVILFLLIYVGSGNYYIDVKDEVSAPYDNTYGNVREQIIEDGRLFDEKTMIAINANRANADGFEEYYLEYGGSGRDVYVVSNEDSDIKERIKAADHIYIYQVMKGTPDVYTDIMGDSFKEVSFDENLRLYEYERVK